MQKQGTRVLWFENQQKQVDLQLIFSYKVCSHQKMVLF